MKKTLEKEIEEVTEKVSERVSTIFWPRVWVGVISFVVIGGLGFTALIAYASSYEDRVLPGVSIGHVAVGGMSRDELKTFLEEMNTKLTDEGITLLFDTNGVEERIQIEPTVVSADFYMDLIRMDVDTEVNALLSYQKEGNLFVRGWAAFLTKLTKPHLALSSVTLDTEQLKEAVEAKLLPYEDEGHNANIHIEKLSPLTYTTVSSTIGVTFAYDDIIGRIVAAWNALQIPEISINRMVKQPTIVESDVNTVISTLEGVIDAGDITLTYNGPSHDQEEESWTITPKDFQSWIEVQKQDNTIGIGLSASSTKAYISEHISSDIDQEAREARFEIGQNGKVSEFQGAQPGIGVDIDATYTALNTAFFERTWNPTQATSTVPLIVEKVEPTVSNAEVNDLGITELLGTGYSNFSGSPTNRIKNIRFATEQKLNGTLIKPGEEFSLLNALKPFTIEAGYLPELVIKGDEIKPEVGGGLCQIGSTLFRAVMNAGLDVLERRNHSLVVSYYNDHRNGKPGTDATIYDPAPDFKFKNDTENYILLTTSMNTATGDLYFSFWGTNDGRKGYYTEPVVHRWIPAGTPETKETTTLAPGVKNCQSAHPGAETSFTYIKTMPSGEKIEEVFTSYYRPLPQICLVGVDSTTPETDSSCQEGDTTCTPSEPVFDPADDLILEDTVASST